MGEGSQANPWSGLLALSLGPIQSWLTSKEQQQLPGQWAECPPEHQEGRHGADPLPKNMPTYPASLWFYELNKHKVTGHNFKHSENIYENACLLEVYVFQKFFKASPLNILENTS